MFSFNTNDTNLLNKSNMSDSTLPSPTEEEQKIKQVFELKDDLTEMQNIYKSVELMKNLKHPNILKLLKGNLNREMLNLEFEYVDYNLEQVISLCSNTLDDESIQYIFYQTVLGVAYMHHMNVQHLDLKPSNIFVKKNLSVKIAGFGNARPTFLKEKADPVLVMQDFFIAPESILNNSKNPEFPFKADIWALGCIFFELLNKKCRLSRKRHYLELLNLIMRLIGKPTKQQTTFIKNDSARSWIKAQRNFPTTLPSSYLGNKKVPLEGKELLNMLLKFDPRERPSIKQILTHPYFSTIYDPMDLNFKGNSLNVSNFEGCSERIFHSNQVYRLIGKSIKSFEL